jgi:hypothetical protein
VRRLRPRSGAARPKGRSDFPSYHAARHLHQQTPSHLIGRVRQPSKSLHSYCCQLREAQSWLETVPNRQSGQILPKVLCELRENRAVTALVVWAYDERAGQRHPGMLPLEWLGETRWHARSLK